MSSAQGCLEPIKITPHSPTGWYVDIPKSYIRHLYAIAAMMVVSDDDTPDVIRDKAHDLADAMLAKPGESEVAAAERRFIDLAIASRRDPGNSRVGHLRTVALSDLIAAREKQEAAP